MLKSSTEKQFRLLFTHVLVTSVAFLLCARHITLKKYLKFEQSVVEKLPSFAKLVSPFRNSITSTSVEVSCFLLFDLTCSWRVPWLLGCG